MTKRAKKAYSVYCSTTGQQRRFASRSAALVFAKNCGEADVFHKSRNIAACGAGRCHGVGPNGERRQRLR